LDEPSAGLDQTQVGHLLDLIAGLPKQLTILLVDHNPDVMRTVADTVTTIGSDRTLTGQTPPEIQAPTAVDERYPHGDRGPQPAGGHEGAAALRVRNLTVGFHRTPILAEVSFDVHAGEAVAVVGRTGSGKSTLLDALMGLTPSGGGIEFDGQQLTGASPRRFAQAGISLVPQRRRLFSLSVAEHLDCAAAVARAPISAQAWTPWTVFSLFPALAARRHHLAGQLSGGEQQMLALARALVANPKLLLLDEPTNALAPPVQELVWAAIKHLTARGGCLLLATTNQQLAAQVADRVVHLEAGRASAAKR
jgi:ABC-type branched-subunit amino acid transport system ATPase component